MRYAKAKHRVAAYVVDYLITAIIIFVVYIPFGLDFLINLLNQQEVAISALSMAQFYRASFIATMLVCAYFVMVPCLIEGQTIGKIIFHIKVVNVNGSRTDALHLFIREIFGKFILNFASAFLAHFVSFILMKSRKDYRATEDMLAGTIVIDVYKTNTRRR